MKYTKLLLFLISFVIASLVLFSCNPIENISPIPQISNLRISKTTLTQGDLNQDSLYISFHFIDGDGDLGFGSTDSRRDIFLIDKRINLLQDQYKIPDLPPQNGKKVEGDIKVLIFTTCCLFPEPIPPCSNPPQFPFDSLQYELYIQDRAANKSNSLVSDYILLKCQ